MLARVLRRGPIMLPWGMGMGQWDFAMMMGMTQWDPAIMMMQWQQLQQLKVITCFPPTAMHKELAPQNYVELTMRISAWLPLALFREIKKQTALGAGAAASCTLDEKGWAGAAASC